MNHTINIDMDNKCRSCGNPGTLDNGLCLECQTKEIQRMVRSVINAVKIENIERLGFATKRRDVKEEGNLIDVEAVTTITIECVNLDPSSIGRLASLVKADNVGMFLGSPQTIMELDAAEAVAVG